MKKKLLLGYAACLIGMTVLTRTGQSQATEPTPTPTVPGTVRPVRLHHPAIHAAINALERAKADMQAAAHDFGGHRADALAACDTAIAQLKLALQYANQNNPQAPTPTP